MKISNKESDAHWAHFLLCAEGRRQVDLQDSEAAYEPREQIIKDFAA